MLKKCWLGGTLVCSWHVVRCKLYKVWIKSENWEVGAVCCVEENCLAFGGCRSSSNGGAGWRLAMSKKWHLFNTWWVVSGRSVMKSHIASGSFKCVTGFLFCVWMNDGKRMGSLIKKIGVLFPTRSQFPSSSSVMREMKLVLCLLDSAQLAVEVKSASICGNVRRVKKMWQLSVCHYRG